MKPSDISVAFLFSGQGESVRHWVMACVFMIAPATLGLAQDNDRVLPGRLVDADNYSIDGDILRGEVVAMDKDEVSVFDINRHEFVKVKVPDSMMLKGIKPGDNVRVSFTVDGLTAGVMVEGPELRRIP